MGILLLKKSRKNAKNSSGYRRKLRHWLRDSQVIKKKGYTVTIAGRHKGRICRAASELGLEYIIADMTDLDSFKEIASQFQNHGLDVLVNNAAMAKFIPLDELSPSDYLLFFNTNFRGPIELIRELLPALKKKCGSITNISSIAVNNGLVNGSLYAATKGALEAATRSLAVELAPKKIRVNAVAPGAIDTPLAAKTGRSKKELLQRRAMLEQIIPLQRYGKPEEVAQVACAQLEATYVTGSVWCVDGGVHIV